MNNTSVCETCATGLKELIAGRGSKIGRFTKAVLFGAGAALVGSAGYYLVTELTGYNLALVSIGVGMFVGKAVRKGSDGRGGWKYQILAALLTYLAIAGTLIPPAITEFRKAGTTESSEVAPDASEVIKAGAASMESPKAILAEDAAKDLDDEKADELASPFARAVGWVFMVGFILIGGPVIVGLEAPLSLLIFGFGIWQAWAGNRRLAVEITGPHQIATVPQRESLPA